MTNTRAYTEINGLDDGRIMFAIVSFEGVLNFTAEGRLYYRIGAHLLDVDGTLPRSISTPYRDRLSGGRLRRLDTVDAAARDCYTWHLQQCMWLDYICNCFLIVMRPVGRARPAGPVLFTRTARAAGSAPWQTTANSARPSSTRGTYLARYIKRTPSQRLPP